MANFICILQKLKIGKQIKDLNIRVIAKKLLEGNNFKNLK